MGKFCGGLLLLFSIQALACPDLTGKFNCTYQDGSTQVVTITQALNKDGVTVYTYNGSALPADNQVYPLKDDQSLKNATYRVWCDPTDANVLQSQLLGQYFSQGSYYGDLTLNMAMTLSGDDLKQTTTGQLKNSGGEYPLNSEEVCQRQGPAGP